MKFLTKFFQKDGNAFVSIALLGVTSLSFSSCGSKSSTDPETTDSVFTLMSTTDLAIQQALENPSATTLSKSKILVSVPRTILKTNTEYLCSTSGRAIVEGTFTGEQIIDHGKVERKYDFVIRYNQCTQTRNNHTYVINSSNIELKGVSVIEHPTVGVDKFRVKSLGSSKLNGDISIKRDSNETQCRYETESNSYMELNDEGLFFSFSLKGKSCGNEISIQVDRQKLSD